MMKFFLKKVKCVMCGQFRRIDKMAVTCGGVGICNDCRCDIKTTGDKTFFGKEIDFVFAPFDYEGNFSRAVRKYKFDGQRLYGKLFAKMLCDETADKKFLREFDMVVPVPLHEKRLRERGFNQTEMLAEALAERLGIIMRNDVLVRTVNTKRQSSLHGYDRVMNVRDAFLADMIEVKDKRILLVDDIYSMGETVRSCSAALKDAGAARVAAVALCKTQRKERPVTLESLDRV